MENNISEFSDESEPAKAHIGQLNLPIITEDTVEIFVNAEKLLSNTPEKMVCDSFVQLPLSSDSDNNSTSQPKIEFNSNHSPWKFLAKNLFDHINEERRSGQKPEVNSIEGGFVGDEFNEFVIYDAPSKLSKKDLTLKKTR